MTFYGHALCLSSAYAHEVVCGGTIIGNGAWHSIGVWHFWEFYTSSYIHILITVQSIHINLT